MKYIRLLVLILISITVVLVQPEGQVQAQSGVIWNTQFFNNAFLSAPAAVTRQDSAIAFNWGTGSPANGVNADNFTARFSTSTYFENATYRFTIVADDGVKLIIDDHTIIMNTFDNPRPSQTITADIQLSAGQHKVQVDFREVLGDAFISVGWTPVSSATVVIVPTPAPSLPTTSGWTAEYFANNNLSGSPAAIQSVISPSNNWGNGSPLSNIPADNFSARWTGNLVLEGTYQLSVRADDGVRVSVNGVSYINEWRNATGNTYTARFTLPRGTHRIIIEYYEATGEAFMEYGLIRNDGGTFTPVNTQTGNISWTAQYYNNIGLTDSPTVNQTEYSISHNWGTGAPVANVSADNFSVRWASVQPLTAGTYRLSVRADDGVRVYINGLSYINEWHASVGNAPYETSFVLPTGNHSFVVEYYEATGVSFIDYSLTRVEPVVSPPQVASSTSSNARITVSASQLNVRQSPSILGRVLTQITKNQSYPIIGRNVDSTWWQVNINGTIGWVNAIYTSASNIQNVAVANTTTQVNPPATRFTVTTTANVNLRTGSATSFNVLNIVPRNTTVSILARNADTTWWQVSYRGIVGWVSAGFVTLQGNTDITQIPVSR